MSCPYGCTHCTCQGICVCQECPNLCQKCHILRSQKCRICNCLHFHQDLASEDKVRSFCNCSEKSPHFEKPIEVPSLQPQQASVIKYAPDNNNARGCVERETCVPTECETTSHLVHEGTSNQKEFSPCVDVSISGDKLTDALISPKKRWKKNYTTSQELSSTPDPSQGQIEKILDPEASDLYRKLPISSTTVKATPVFQNMNKGNVSKSDIPTTTICITPQSSKAAITQAVSTSAQQKLIDRPPRTIDLKTALPNIDFLSLFPTYFENETQPLNTPAGQPAASFGPEQLGNVSSVPTRYPITPSKKTASSNPAKSDSRSSHLQSTISILKKSHIPVSKVLKRKVSEGTKISTLPETQFQNIYAHQKQTDVVYPIAFPDQPASADKNLIQPTSNSGSILLSRQPPSSGYAPEHPSIIFSPSPQPPSSGYAPEYPSITFEYPSIPGYPSRFSTSQQLCFDSVPTQTPSFCYGPTWMPPSLFTQSEFSATFMTQPSSSANYSLTQSTVSRSASTPNLQSTYSNIYTNPTFSDAASYQPISNYIPLYTPTSGYAPNQPSDYAPRYPPFSHFSGYAPVHPVSLDNISERLPLGIVPKQLPTLRTVSSSPHSSSFWSTEQCATSTSCVPTDQNCDTSEPRVSSDSHALCETQDCIYRTEQSYRTLPSSGQPSRLSNVSSQSASSKTPVLKNKLETKPLLKTKIHDSSAANLCLTSPPPEQPCESFQPSELSVVSSPSSQNPIFLKLSLDTEIN